MMNWLLLIANSIAGGFIQYQHQTNAVSDSSYPVTRPPAKVSVIIPAFNEEAFIQRALLSIQSQNIVLEYPSLFEIIVVDDGSTDCTAEIASEYARVIVADHRGVDFVRHTGIEAAEGDIIVLFDADSIMKPNFLNLLLRHFHNPEIVASCGGYFTVGGNVVSRYIETNVNTLLSVLKPTVYLGICAFRKETYYAIGKFDFGIDQFQSPEEYRRYAEREFAKRLKSVGKVVWDLEANVWTEARFQHCLMHPYDDELCESAYCRYCRDREARLRF